MAQKSISQWATCDGQSDDTAAVASAIDAAKNNAFTLIVDCPVRIEIKSDIAKAIFIDSGTTVQFTGAGKISVDNVLMPAFVIANANNIVLTDWNVEYDASLPVDIKTGGYTDAGAFVPSNADAPASGAFNDVTLAAWLTKNRSITFDRSGGNYTSPVWAGPTNSSAIFFITGDSGNLTVTGMNIYAPSTAGGDHFIPMAFSFTRNYRNGDHVTASTPLTTALAAVPHDLTFSNIHLDGIYMGWQGNVQNMTVDTVTSLRYSDLQDAHGGTVGGVGKWFAPPHLFYFNYDVAGDPGLYNKNISIHDVIDAGPRIGVARDKGGSDTISGYALSLKIGGVNCSVDQYVSNRPDGVMDVYSSNGLTISNLTATYNSAFINNLYSGVRFPNSPYRNVTLNNISVTDAAPTTQRLPIDGSNENTDESIVLQDVHVTVNNWSGAISPIPSYLGQQNSISMDFSFLGNDSMITHSQKTGIQVTLQGSPITLKPGGAMTLAWQSKLATSCSAAGAWDGGISGGGTRVIKPDAAGNYNFGIYCQNTGYSTNVALPVTVQ